MAINRKGYTSLIESVQETVSQSVNEAPASGAALSYQLQHQSNQGAAHVSTGGRIVNKTRKGKPTMSNRAPGSASKPMAKTPKAPSASVVSEDWDILDEILAEGIELYGEDGLAEILADFAETGEISDELALLLSDE
jgi:hypothetical protein